MACLAEDQTARIETNEVVRGTLTFVTDDGSTEYSSGQVEAIVWNITGADHPAAKRNSETDSLAARGSVGSTSSPPV